LTASFHQLNQRCLNYENFNVKYINAFQVNEYMFYTSADA